MRKIIIKISFVSIILASIVVNFAQSKSAVSLNSSLATLNMLAVANAEGESCSAGGPGSTSCSYSGSIWGVTQECSVTCSSGYYSCCYLGWDQEAHCECREA